MRHEHRRRRLRLGAAILATGLAAWFAPAAADDGFRSRIVWRTDLAEARVLAEQEGKPLYVVFRCIP